MGGRAGWKDMVVLIKGVQMGKTVEKESRREGMGMGKKSIWQIIRGVGHLQNNLNKMQSETADFAPGAGTWRTGRKLRNIRAVLDGGPAATTGNVYRKFGRGF